MLFKYALYESATQMDSWRVFYGACENLIKILIFNLVMDRFSVKEAMTKVTVGFLLVAWLNV